MLVRHSIYATKRMLSNNHTTMIPPVQDFLFHFVPTGKPDDFFYFSAWNPGGPKADDGSNIQADESLRRTLADEDQPVEKRKPLPHFRVLRTSHDESLMEQGWAVQCRRSLAVKLAKQFKAGVLWKVAGGTVAATNVKTLETIHTAALPAHFRDPRDVRHFILIVGSPSGSNRLDPMEYAGVCTRAGALFSNFTIQKADGCFQSRFEDTAIIHIATREPRKVLTLAHELRCFLNQIGIGISHNGIYQRVRDWTDDDMILESFGLEAPDCRRAAKIAIAAGQVHESRPRETELTTSYL